MNQKLKISIAVLCILYAVGTVGISLFPQSALTSLSALNLWLTAIIVLLNHKEWNKAFYIFLGSSYLIGFLMEVLGVQTGVIFGVYEYGDNLGLKLWDVPLVIGLNWVMVAYGSSCIVHSFLHQKWQQVIGTASLMVLLDSLIEPVAPILDFWSWEIGYAPLQNYIAWFLIAISITILNTYLPFSKENKSGQALFILQIIFFSTLNLCLN